MDTVDRMWVRYRMAEIRCLRGGGPGWVPRGASYGVALLIALAFLCPEVPSYGASPDLDSITLPPGFEIGLFAADLGAVRFMAIGPSGALFASVPRAGRVFALLDQDGDGEADTTAVFADGLDLPHGLAFRDGDLYVAETGRVVRLRDENGDLRADGQEVIVAGLPPSGGHWTRTIGFGPDGKLYVSIGSSCNVCIEGDPRRAAIVQYDPDGSGERIYATGLRNSVGFVWHPETGEMWATDNGRDWLGDDLPPDEINIIVDGGFYGWPHCYGQNVSDPDFGDRDRCATGIPPAVELQAHSAPLGLAFYTGTAFPETYRGDLFVAYHGSWNRSIPTGYKVVRVRMEKGRPAAVEDFAGGWLQGGNAWGRPVDVLVWTDGSLLVTDDRTGCIYRIGYTAPGTDVEDVETGELVPERYRLEQNVPNPFNARTAIRYHLKEAASITLSLYDLSGRRLRVLVDEVRSAGAYSAVWDGTDQEGKPVASGIYLFRMTVGGFATARKMLVLR